MALWAIGTFRYAHSRTVRACQRGEWEIRTTTRTVLTCDDQNFYLDAELDAFEGKRRVFSPNWNRIIKRNLL